LPRERILAKLFPNLFKEPLFPRLWGEYIGITPETLTPAQRELMERYKSAIATVLGVPPEAIREDMAARWVIEWSKKLVKPEYWKMISSKVRDALEI